MLLSGRTEAKLEISEFAIADCTTAIPTSAANKTLHLCMPAFIFSVPTNSGKLSFIPLDRTGAQLFYPYVHQILRIRLRYAFLPSTDIE